ncbi:hypothetical protein [Exiguobacterium sp. UBA4551]|uniref:hypothetical protein n=1 Tax=Exiguobacterium sp. UBA4551 TaxID=1946494 RepID=UPI00227651E9|nr:MULTISPECIES: hypothetical protein [unclassified Exiguobacterium]MCY1690227.1 hypothetical protein [Exiguobacterium sp. SL14]
MSYSYFFTSILNVVGIFFLFYLQNLGMLERWQFFVVAIVLFVVLQAFASRLFRRFEEKRFHPQTAVFLIVLLFAGIIFVANALYP